VIEKPALKDSPGKQGVTVCVVASTFHPRLCAAKYVTVYFHLLVCKNNY